MEKQTVLIIGGSGFIGHHLARALHADGHTVHATHSPGRLPPTTPGIHWLACDLGAPEATENWPRCQTLVFVAQGRHRRDFPGAAAEVFGVNVAGLHESVHFALQSGVERFLYASTGSIYAPLQGPAQETRTFDLAAPRTFYAASKLAAEVLLGPYGALMPIGILRLFTPYGPEQSPDMLLPQLVDKVRCGRPIHLHGSHGLLANPVSVGDVVETFMRMLELKSSVTCNVGGPDILTLREVGETIGAVLEQVPVFECCYDQPVPCVVGEMDALQAHLGWSPQVKLETGLRLWLAQPPLRRAG